MSYITYGSRIVSQVSVNKIPEQPIISNDSNVKGVKGNELYSGHSKETGSMVGLTAAAGALLGFASISSIGGPGTYTPECEGFDAHPDNMCVICYKGRWTHYDELYPCSLHAEGTRPFDLIPACYEIDNVGCQICGGPCFQCNSDGEGNYSCDEKAVFDSLTEECLECHNSTEYCGSALSPYRFVCEGQGEIPSCCSGTCIDAAKECSYYHGTYPDVTCVVGCEPFTCEVCVNGFCTFTCGECQKCDTGVCVHDSEGYDNQGEPCGDYVQSLINGKIIP